MNDTPLFLHFLIGAVYTFTDPPVLLLFLIGAVFITGYWISSSVEKLTKSTRSDNAKVQALLTEIRDRLDK